MRKKIITTIIVLLSVLLVLSLLSWLLNGDKDLKIVIKPSTASVIVDGEALPEGYNGEYQLNVKKGSHEIMAVNPGFLSSKETITVGIWGSKEHNIELSEGPRIINGLPYSDKKQNFYIYGYYNDEYAPTYKVSLFNDAAKELATDFLRKRGVKVDSVNIIYIEEWDNGSGAPN